MKFGVKNKTIFCQNRYLRKGIWHKFSTNSDMKDFWMKRFDYVARIFWAHVLHLAMLIEIIHPFIHYEWKKYRILIFLLEVFLFVLFQLLLTLGVCLDFYGIMCLSNFIFIDKLFHKINIDLSEKCTYLRGYKIGSNQEFLVFFEIPNKFRVFHFFSNFSIIFEFP